jgi:flagellin-like protein
MKKVWKNKDEAVSPVIATILMVAITVVLAAVLYVMVIGFGTGGQSTPAGAWNTVEATGRTTGKLTFGQFTTTTEPMDIKIFVKTGGSTAEISWPNAPTAQNASITCTGIAGVTASYFDYAYAGNAINSGDYIQIWGLTAGTTYTIEVFHIPSESTVSMTGDTASFSTPP